MEKRKHGFACDATKFILRLTRSVVVHTSKPRAIFSFPFSRNHRPRFLRLPTTCSRKNHVQIESSFLLRPLTRLSAYITWCRRTTHRCGKWDAFVSNGTDFIPAISLLDFCVKLAALYRNLDLTRTTNCKTKTKTD